MLWRNHAFFVPYFCTKYNNNNKKNALCLLGYKKTPLIWFEAPVAPVVTHCPWVCRGSACECFITMGLHTERVLFCSVPHLVDTAGDESLISPVPRQASTGCRQKSTAYRWTEESVAYIARQTNNNEGLYLLIEWGCLGKWKSEKAVLSEKMFPVQFFMSSGLCSPQRVLSAQE